MNTYHNSKRKRNASRLAASLICLLFSTLILSSCGSNLSSSENATSVKNQASTESTAGNPSSETATEQMEIHFLDVGQGLSVLVISDGEVLIYDGGDRSHSDFVVSYLKEQGIDKIDYLISSHYDSDHVSGLIGCLYAFPVETVITADYEYNSTLYNSFYKAIDANGLTVIYPEVGTSFDFGTGDFTILSPQTIYNDSNNNSVSIKLTNGKNHFLFTGDAEFESESEMVHSGIDLSCDVLCVGHHGSASSTSWDFLQASVPEYAVISCGKENSYGHPHEETMEKLASMEIPVFRTDIQGTIIAVSDGTCITWNFQPSNNYSSDEIKTPETTYVLNTNSNKFHYRDCESAKQISNKNRQEFHGTRDELIQNGYEPCGNCRP